MERQEAVECFTREAEPVLEEGKKLFYRELQEKTEQLSAVICDAIHEIRLETVRLEKEKMMLLAFFPAPCGAGKRRVPDSGAGDGCQVVSGYRTGGGWIFTGFSVSDVGGYPQRVDGKQPEILG